MNYSEEKALREEQKQAAGLLSERFPQVLTIVIDMTFNRKSINPAHMKRTMYFYPDTYAYFHWGCMTRSCEDGFDLSHVISNMVRDHAETRTGEMECANVDRNHASILYEEIKVQYALDH